MIMKEGLRQKVEVKRTDKTLKQGLCVELFIEVRDKEGKLIATRYKKSDLILDNFRKCLLFGILGKANVEVKDATVSLTDEGGASRSPWVAYDYAGDAVIRSIALSVLHSSAVTERKIAIGTGTVAPTRGDYALGTKVGESVYVTVAEFSDYVTYAASITLTTAYDITEAGLFRRFRGGSATGDAGGYWFLMFRDTFSAVPVPAGGTVSVTFKVTI